MKKIRRVGIVSLLISGIIFSSVPAFAASNNVGDTNKTTDYMY